MNNPFKKETPKQPLNTPVIEMRKNSGGYQWLVVGVILLALLLFGLFLKIV